MASVGGSVMSRHQMMTKSKPWPLLRLLSTQRIGQYHAHQTPPRLTFSPWHTFKPGYAWSHMHCLPAVARGASSAQLSRPYTSKAHNNPEYKSVLNGNGEQASGGNSSEISPKMWLEVLENTANAPWLALEHTSHDSATPADRMKRAYSRIFQIVMYLGRPQENAEAFLMDFEKAAAPPGSDLARSRRAVTVLMRTVVRDLASIPLNSTLRTQYTATFDLAGALITLHDMYLSGPEDTPEGEIWSQFWDRAQPVLLTLGMSLDKDGFGLQRGDTKEDDK